jgi:hypothetical protein
MNLELWQILGNQAFDDAFYAEMLQCLSFAQNDTATGFLGVNRAVLPFS